MFFTIYQCTVSVSDGQASPNVATQAVTITVIRVPAPTWIPDPLVQVVQMRENDVIGYDVFDLEAFKSDLRVSLYLLLNFEPQT